MTTKTEHKAAHPDYTDLLVALAKANQHPDPEAFAKQVTAILEAK